VPDRSTKDFGTYAKDKKIIGLFISFDLFEAWILKKKFLVRTWAKMMVETTLLTISIKKKCTPQKTPAF